MNVTNIREVVKENDNFIITIFDQTFKVKDIIFPLLKINNKGDLEPENSELIEINVYNTVSFSTEKIVMELCKQQVKHDFGSSYFKLADNFNSMYYTLEFKNIKIEKVQLLPLSLNKDQASLIKLFVKVDSISTPTFSEQSENTVNEVGFNSINSFMKPAFKEDIYWTLEKENFEKQINQILAEMNENPGSNHGKTNYKELFDFIENFNRKNPTDKVTVVKEFTKTPENILEETMKNGPIINTRGNDLDSLENGSFSWPPERENKLD